MVSNARIGACEVDALSPICDPHRQAAWCKPLFYCEVDVLSAKPSQTCHRLCRCLMQTSILLILILLTDSAFGGHIQLLSRGDEWKGEICSIQTWDKRCIHSKREDPDPNYPAKKIEFSANLPKNATKWPKNGQKWPEITQSGPNMTPYGPKWP